MPVGIDQISTYTSAVGPVTTFTYNGATVSSGLTNSALVAFIFFTTVGNPTTLTVTWDSGGTNQNMINNIGTGSSSQARLRCYCLLNPTPGNKSLVASWTNATGYGIVVVSLTGVLQTSNATAFINGTSTTFVGTTLASLGITTNASNDLILGMIATGAAITPAFGTHVFQNGSITTGSSVIVECEATTPTSTTTTFNWGIASSSPGSYGAVDVVWDGTTGAAATTGPIMLANGPSIGPPGIIRPQAHLMKARPPTFPKNPDRPYGLPIIGVG